MKKIKTFLKFSVIFLGNFLFSIEFKQLIEKIKQKENQIETIKMHYTQVINFVDLKETYEIKAKFLYARPDKIKIEISAPIKQIVVADSDMIYVKDLTNDIIYQFNSKKYFEKEHNYLPLIFSKKNMRYEVTEFLKKMGVKLIKEENKYYVLSTKFEKKNDNVTKQTRFVIWINKETLFPEKIYMTSPKYIIETEFSSYEVNFEYSLEDFEIEKTTNTKIVEIR
ncbi:MAG: outer-membrane lipoprotein carrier protein LolA [Endomicrobiia bacterium]